MKKTISKAMSLLVAVMMISGMMIIPASATEAATQTLGEVLLYENFGIGTTGEAALGGYNGWTENNGTSSTQVLDSVFTVEPGTETNVFNSNHRAPLDRVAKLYRETSNTSSGSYFVYKNLDKKASSDATILSLRFNLMMDSNAKWLQFRFNNGGTALSFIRKYSRSGEKWLVSTGPTANIEPTLDTFATANKWYDVETFIDFTNNKLSLYVDGAYIGEADLNNAVFGAGSSIDAVSDLSSLYVGSNRNTALVDGSAPGAFYIDDITVSAYKESERNALAAQKLGKFIPSTVTPSHVNPASTAVILPDTSILSGSSVAWSSTSDLLTVSGTSCTVNHPATGDIQPATLTATITSGETVTTHNYTVNVAPQNVYIAEDFEGYSEKLSSGFSGVNGWIVDCSEPAGTVTNYTKYEDVVKLNDGNSVARITSTSNADTKASIAHTFKKAFGRTMSSAVAGNGFSTKFSIMSPTDSAKSLNILYTGGKVNEIYTLSFKDGYINVGGTNFIYAEPGMVISATQKYPREGAVAGKWYDMEIRSDLKSGGYATVYVNGQIAGKVALTANTAAPYLMIQPVRNGFGNSAEVNIDNIICTALTALEKEINDAADAITLFEGTVYDDIALPSTVGDSISVTWASDDESVITNNGKIVTANPDTAMMTATFTKGGETVVRSYRVNTGAKNAVELASVSMYLKNVTVNVDSARLPENAKLIAGAFSGGRLYGAGTYDIPNEIGTYDISLGNWWTDDKNIPSDATVKFFVWDGGKLSPILNKREQAADATAIFLCGDSTLDGYRYPNAKKADVPENKRITGWGEALDELVDSSKAIVENYALSGSSAKSFYNGQYQWQTVKTLIKEGDYVIIQFGHNDVKAESNDGLTREQSQAEFKEYLLKMVDETIEKGGIPVFATSINRKYFVNGAFNESMYGYPEKMLELATELDIPVIDLHTKTAQWLSEEGEFETLKYYLYFHDGSDTTHLTPMGARFIAQMAVNEIKDNAFLSELADLLK